MTIEEAIKIFEDLSHTMHLSNRCKEYAAVDLGIEALKRILEYRDSLVGDMSLLSLPGETWE